MRKYIIIYKKSTNVYYAKLESTKTKCLKSKEISKQTILKKDIDMVLNEKI